LFEVQETKGNTMALQLQGLLKKFEQIHCVLAFVKDEGNNLGSMALYSIVDYEASRRCCVCKKVLVLGMSCLKLTNTQPTMIRFQ